MKVGSILPQDDFCGSTFPTPKGGVLTVVGHNGLKSSKKKYYCTCRICHKDLELFPDYFESTKGNLLSGRFPCGCSASSKLNDTQRSIMVFREATKRGHEFRGFVGGKYNGTNNTYLIMYCPEHGEWTSTVYAAYMSGKGCPSCGGTQKIQNPEERINSIATERGHEFRGFVGGKYNGTNNTYLILFCPDHGEWTSSTYDSYMRGSGCPVCGGTQKIQNPEDLIIEEATKRGHEFRGFVGGKYNGTNNTYLIMYCPEHGEWTSTIYRSYMDGSGCPVCGGSQKIQNPEERIAEEATKRGHEFRGFVGGKYNGVHDTYPIMYCPDHGEWTSSTYDSYMRGSGCPVCGGTQKIQNPEERINSIATERGHEFRGFVGGKYNGTGTYLILFCPDHGEWTSTIYANYMKTNVTRCSGCAGTGYSQQKPGTFYIIHYEYEGEVFLKYGITNRDTTSRMAEHYKGMKNVTCTILKEYYFEDGTIPFKMEQAVNTKYKGGVTTCLTSGNTETAPHYDFSEVKLLAESVLKGI